MTRLILSACAALFCLINSAAAQAPAELLESFEGVWTAQGDAFGGAAESRMEWSPALNGKFFRLDYRVVVTQEGDGSFVFDGVAHYQLGSGEELRAYWADNMGDLHPIRAEREGDAMIAHWGVEGAKQGRTRYELLPSGEIEVTDWIRTDDGWRQFNQGLFSRSRQD